MNIQDKIAQRKTQLTVAAEFSESALDQLAIAELAEQTASIVNQKCDHIDTLLKSSGVQRDWKTHAKYEYGTSVGSIGRFIAQWIYLPDALKLLTGLSIPTTAFNSDMLDAWGRLSYCNALGVVTEATQPDLASVATQVEMVKYYLQLDYVEPVLTVEQWEHKQEIAKARSFKKQADISSAELDNELAKELGVPTFTI